MLLDIVNQISPTSSSQDWTFMIGNNRSNIVERRHYLCIYLLLKRTGLAKFKYSKECNHFDSCHVTLDIITKHVTYKRHAHYLYSVHMPYTSGHSDTSWRVIYQLILMPNWWWWSFCNIGRNWKLDSNS